MRGGGVKGGIPAHEEDAQQLEAMLPARPKIENGSPVRFCKRQMEGVEG